MSENKFKKLPIDYMPQISNIASSTECTGLIPILPENEDELESYMSLSSSSLPPVWDSEDLDDVCKEKTPHE